ncbi:MAG: lysylphosphatidylglycerol synthase transmembrane domain-containing protein [Candidatus Sumerlaeaceae bacterium]
MTSSSQSLRSRTVLLIRILLAAGLLIVVFRIFADFHKTVEKLRNASVPLLLFGLAIAIIGETLTAYKWKLLLAHLGERLRLRESVRISLIGMFYNNFLPGSLGGDVARTVFVAERVGGSMRAAASVFMQRNTGLAGLLIVANLASWIWPERIPPVAGRYELPYLLSFPAVWFAMATAGYVAINLALVSEPLYKLIWKTAQGPDHVHVGWRGRLLGALHTLHEEIRYYRSYWSVPLLLSVLTQVIDSTLVYIASRALGLQLPFHPFLIAVPMVTLAAMLPISFNGIGLREAGYVLLLASSAVAPEAAVGISLIQFSYIAILSLLGGLLHLHMLHQARASNT